MDESTFQQELIRLKNHVASISATYRLPPCYDRDAFGDQLVEIKARLQSLETGLNCLTHAQRQPDSLQASSHIDSARCMSVNNLITAENLTLPSGPLFWQLFSSLRMDVRGLDDRVASLEHDVSDLDDRVDKLEPPHLTPTSSENASSSYSGWEQPSTAESMSQTQVDNHFPYVAELNNWQHRHGHSFATAGMTSSPALNNLSRPLDSVSSSAAPEGVAFRDREIAQLEELMRGEQSKLAHTEDLLRQCQSHIRYLATQRNQFHARTVDLERICAEQESTLQSQRSTLEQKQAELSHLHAEDIAKDASLQEWMAKHHAAQQSYLRKKSQMHYADQQIQQLQHTIFELHCSKHDEIDQVIASKDEEIQKLRDLFEAKEVVVSEQEKIIARGADLMEERDGEIERLSEELKLSKDDFQSENQERIGIARTLKERNDEITQLRASLTHALMPRSVLSNKADKSDNSAVEASTEKRHGHQDSIPSRALCSPFATTAAGVAGQPRAQRWIPKAFDHHHDQLPHERKRASAWETGATNDAVGGSKFGEPGSLRPLPPTKATAKSVLRERKRDLRRSDSLRLLERLALIEDGTSRLHQAPTEVANSSRRHRLPLDSLYPPLPMPSSDANLTHDTRADDENTGNNGLIPQQSYQGHPDCKGPPQPYVEDDVGDV